MKVKISEDGGEKEREREKKEKRCRKETVYLAKTLTK
jgi:hypothetical protein